MMIYHYHKVIYCFLNLKNYFLKKQEDYTLNISNKDYFDSFSFYFYHVTQCIAPPSSNNGVAYTRKISLSNIFWNVSNAAMSISLS